MASLNDISVTLDTSGKRCPIPLLLAKKALKGMETGAILEVLATDPSAKPDFDAMLKHLPHALVSYEVLSDQPKLDRFLIQKGES